MIKKRMLIFLVFVVLSIGVFAQNETDLPSFGTAEEEGLDIFPPSPPETISVYKPKLVLELKSFDTKNLISDIHINLILYNMDDERETKTLQYVGGDGLLAIPLDAGRWRITLKVDELLSDGKDFFIQKDFNIVQDMSQTLFLFPVGSVRGNVYDNKGSALRGADVKFECSGSYGEIETKQSDAFGTFSSYWLPVGSCRISVVYGDKVGYQEFNIEKGKLSNIEIVLDKKIATRQTGLFFGFIIAIFVIIGVVYLYRKKPKVVEEIETEEERKEIKEEIKEKKEEEIEETQETQRVSGPQKSERFFREKEEELNKRTVDVMKTLKDRERKVVEFLLENENKSTQSKIRYETTIPKTSLIRIFESLENKNIIKIERVGKLKKIELTEWFLGED